MFPPRGRALLWVSSLIAILTLGCGDKGPPPRQQQHIRGLWHLYLEFTRAHKGQAPKDAAELREWSKANVKPDRLGLMGITSLEDAFTSPRDGQPYVVRPVKSDEMHTALKPGDTAKVQVKAPVAIYEVKGENGRRYVAYAFGEVAELADGVFQRIVQP